MVLLIPVLFGLSAVSAFAVLVIAVFKPKFGKRALPFLAWTSLVSSVAWFGVWCYVISR